MEWKQLISALVLLVVPGMGVTSAQSVTVRSYNNFGVPAADLQAARTLADAIFRDAGIEVTWMDCWFRDREPAEASPRCRQPRGGTDIILRLQAGRPSAGTKFVSMGFTLVGSGQDAAYLSTVFADLVQPVARGAASDPRRVLGLAIAHEIGHALLNSKSHAAAGLMRAGWSRSELQRNNPADWRFLDKEAEAMRAAVATRGNGN